MIKNTYSLSTIGKIKKGLVKLRSKLFKYDEVKYKKLFWDQIKTIRESAFNLGEENEVWTGKLQNIQIETVNRCNGECAFCPVNKYSDSRKLAKMAESLFDKIIDELHDENYEESLALFSNNEPLIDDRLADFARKAREKLPKAYIYIYTNGTLLNLEKCKELARYLNRILIDCYDDNLTIPDNIQEIENECRKDPRLDAIVHIRLRKVNEVLSSRGGQAPNKVQSKVRRLPCLMPFQQMIIRPDGKISLCCNDALGKMTLGDLNKQTIREVWNSRVYSEIRKEITEHPENIELCKFCDSLLRHDLSW